MIDDALLLPVVVLVCFAAIVALEVFLAKKGKRPGLVLPFTFLGLSVAVFAGMLVTKAMVASTVQNFMTTSPDGIPIAPAPSFLGITSRDLVQALLYFLLCNAFTAILFAAYAIYRRRQRRRQALKQMRMQDL